VARRAEGEGGRIEMSVMKTHMCWRERNAGGAVQGAREVAEKREDYQHAYIENNMGRM